MEIHIKLSNGQVLRGIIKSPGENMRAGVILVHGIGEHLGRYSHWMKNFNDNGIGFVGVDLPGHGKSDGKRGNIKGYNLTDEMLDLLIAEHTKTFPGIPVFIYGHSLGGGIVLQYLLKKNPVIKGAIVTSPWLRLTFEPDKYKVKLANLVRGLIPSFTQASGLVVSNISHDQNVVEKYIADPLNHDRISISLFHNAITAGEYSFLNAADLKIPLLILHGSDDNITSPKASLDFASKTKMAEIKIWEGGFHELHNELFKDKVFSYVLKWIEAHI